MAIDKEAKVLGVAWEQEYNYSQAVKVGDTIYLSGQVSHNEKGDIVGIGDMEAQMQQAYANVQKVLAQYGATMENVVDEVLFVTNMETAYAAAVKRRKEIFSGTAIVASTIVQIVQLAAPEMTIEIKCVAKV
jgi:2-iminobutanoate/2-iminopropanoate deaminase